MPQVAKTATFFFPKQNFLGPEPRCHYKLLIRASVLTPCLGTPVTRGPTWKRDTGPLERLSKALEPEVNSKTDRTSPTPCLQNAAVFNDSFLATSPHPTCCPALRKGIQLLVPITCWLLTALTSELNAPEGILCLVRTSPSPWHQASSSPV